MVENTRVLHAFLNKSNPKRRGETLERFPGKRLSAPRPGNASALQAFPGVSPVGVDFWWPLQPAFLKKCVKMLGFYLYFHTPQKKAGNRCLAS